MARSLALTIKLLSDAAPGTGVGRAGAIDQDVPCDEYGLPLLTGRRLKGLIREAVLQVEEWGLAPAGVTQRLCGSGSARGLLRVSTGTLAEYAALRSWLPWCREVADTEFGFERVISQFAYLRQQTAIDRSTGAPLAHTLRRIRVLRRGLEFIAAATIDSDEPALVEALALGSAAVRRLGTSRTRGLGHVSCTLHEGANNVTADTLARRRAGSVP